MLGKSALFDTSTWNVIEIERMIRDTSKTDPNSLSSITDSLHLTKAKLDKDLDTLLEKDDDVNSQGYRDLARQYSSVNRLLNIANYYKCQISLNFQLKNSQESSSKW